MKTYLSVLLTDHLKIPHKSVTSFSRCTARAAPWISSEIKILLHKKNMERHKYKPNDSDANWEKDIKSRNNVAMHKDAIYNSVDGDTVKTRKFVDTIGVSKSHKSVSVNIDIDLLNNHFKASNIIQFVRSSL